MPEDHPTLARLRTLALRVLAALALVAALCIGCVNCAGWRALRRSEAARARDPETGILRGAEPVRIDRGRRGACLLLHGWITTPADFGGLPQALDEAGWDVFAPLQAGHGTTPRALKGITPDKLLDTARGHYGALRGRYGRVVLIGFSMGGAMATILAAEQPPDRLVLIAPFCGVRHKWYYVLPPRWWNTLLSPVVGYVPRPKSCVYCNRPEGKDAILTYDAFHTDAAGALFALRHKLLRKTDLTMLTMPTLLVYGRCDETCSPEATDALFARLPADPKQRVVLPDSNHHLLHDYDRQQAIATIVEFVGKP